MPALPIIMFALLPVLLAVSAACSAAETALFSLTQADRMRLRKSYESASTAAEALLRQPRSLLVAILLANVTVNTAFFTLAGLVGKELLGDMALAAAGFSIGSVLAMILFAEVLPKAIASVHRVAVCRLLAIPVFAWFTLISPLRLVLDRIVIGPLARLFRPAGAGEAEPLTAEDLSNLVSLHAEQGVLHEGEEQLLADVVQLSTLRVRDIMIPRVDVRWLDAVNTSQELLQVARETGYTRFPVCRGRLDERQLVGIVNVQRVLPRLAKQGVAARLPLPGLVDDVRFVPERARVDQLIELFRACNCDAALVVNETGELVGFVQVDNVVNELVKFAASSDETPRQQVRMVALGEWEVPGRLSVHHWEEFFEPMEGTRREGVSTVAGLVLMRLGRVPRVGDMVMIGNVRLVVDAMSGRNIERVRVSITEVGGPVNDVSAAKKEATS
jgi:putative hemolysin